MTEQSTPWLRKIAVTIGPLEEYKGATSGDIKELISDGTQDGLKVVCKISKTVNGKPSPSTIIVYNLSRATKSAITSLTKVTVEVGWQNTEMHKVFQGSVLSVVSERQGPDIITKINCMQGYGAMVRSTTSMTYNSGMPVKNVVKDLGGRMPNVAVNDANLKSIDGTIGASGWSFAGNTSDALTELANEYGFSWTIDDGALRAVGDKATFDGKVVLNGKDGGLIMASPTFKGPLQTREGIKIKAMYVPGVETGALVEIKSSLDESLDGSYRIHTATFDLDAHSDVWFMDLEARKP